MDLENQVVSLKLAKKLKKLGAPQESVWYWVSVGGIHPSGQTLSTDIYLEIVGQLEELEQSPHHYGEDIEVRQKYAAYTVAELLEMLPTELRSNGWKNWDNRFELTAYGGKKWLARYYAGDAFDTGVTAKTAANACAGQLIYLAENNLISFKDFAFRAA